LTRLLWGDEEMSQKFMGQGGIEKTFGQTPLSLLPKENTRVAQSTRKRRGSTLGTRGSLKKQLAKGVKPRYTSDFLPAMVMRFF